METSSKNIISQTVEYICNLFIAKINNKFSESTGSPKKENMPLPKFKGDESFLWKFIIDNQLNLEEVVVLVLALIPHFDPSLLGKIIADTLPTTSNFPEIGGTKDENNRYFLPTGETVLFLLSNNEFQTKNRISQLFSSEHLFSKKGILYLEKVKNGMPKTLGRLIMDDEYVELFLNDKNVIPTLSINFPATHLTTPLEWEDLILPYKTEIQIEEIKNWIEYQKVLMEDWGMNKKLKPGYRALFHGVPGTGKTLTATLLGKYTGLEVFRIDLSMVVSKFIGETEKNLATLFNKAKNKNWILFFDEADALFGKRTNVRDAHDKYANQEVSYLLQRIENYPGLVILASNFKNNIDSAFTRRFQSIIAFSMPQAEERFKIWKNAFPKNIKMAKDLDLKTIAQSYELSGSNIMNVVQFACLKALSKKTKTIKSEFILKGIQKEFEKEGKMF